MYFHFSIDSFEFLWRDTEGFERKPSVVQRVICFRKKISTHDSILILRIGVLASVFNLCRLLIQF